MSGGRENAKGKERLARANKKQREENPNTTQFSNHENACKPTISYKPSLKENSPNREWAIRRKRETSKPLKIKTRNRAYSRFRPIDLSYNLTFQTRETNFFSAELSYDLKEF